MLAVRMTRTLASGRLAPGRQLADGQRVTGCHASLMRRPTCVHRQPGAAQRDMTSPSMTGLPADAVRLMDGQRCIVVPQGRRLSPKQRSAGSESAVAAPPVYLLFERWQRP